MSEMANQGLLRTAVAAPRLRRLVDVVGAGTAVIFLLPVLAIIALAIWIEGGRPILYSQLRLGLKGSPFRMYKFRKFRTDCDEHGTPLTMVNDDRMTMIGELLARFKLDELPQLWNVLRGDMSFVGPRPETLTFADCFRNGFEKILDHKPGHIGPCQVLFRHENTLFPREGNVADFYREFLFPAKAKIDLAYYANRTAMSDLWWVASAVWIVVGEPLLDSMRRSRPRVRSGTGARGESLVAKILTSRVDGCSNGD